MIYEANRQTIRIRSRKIEKIIQEIYKIRSEYLYFNSLKLLMDIVLGANV